MPTLNFAIKKTKDKSNHRLATVQAIKVLKGNHKALAANFEAEICEHKGATVGDFHLVIKKGTKAGKVLKVGKGDVLFNSTKDGKFQALPIEEFQKRFPEFKF